MREAVVLREVTKSYGGREVVATVSLSVGKGECFGLMGPNGAGKSTTLRMVCGLVRPSSGTVFVNGRDVTVAPRATRAALGIAPQEDLLDSDLNVSQNLLFHGRYHRLPRAEARHRCTSLLREAGLEGREDDAVSQLSTGLRRRLALARALMTDPSILVLDEPTRALDRESRSQFLRTVQSLKERGTTILLATHDLAEAEALCDRAAIMESGKVLADGSLWEILQRFRDLGGTLPPAGAAPC